MKCFRYLLIFIFTFSIAFIGTKRNAIANSETVNYFISGIPIQLHTDYVQPNLQGDFKSTKKNTSIRIANTPEDLQLLKSPLVNINILLTGIISLMMINIVLLYFFIKKKKRKKELERENQQYDKQLQHWKQEYNKQSSSLNLIPDILFVFNDKNKIIDVKTHQETLLPLPKYKIQGNSIEHVFAESYLLVKSLQKTQSEQSMQSFEFTFSDINYEAQMIPLQEGQAMCLLRDNSRENNILERLEDDLHKLEETHTGRDKFFSIIAHDLKNPFNALIGFSSLLNEEFDDLTDEETKEYIKQIYQSSDSLFKLLRNLLAWTKSRTGDMEFNPQKIDFNSILHENLKILWPEAQQKNINLYSSSKNDSIYVFADNNMLNSIIRNLTANAIKFTEPGGVISMSAHQKETYMECSISDNGVGIADEDVKNIFKIDNKVRSQGTQNEEGTGLGLLLCKEFVEKHGGEIWVESKKDQGSTFYFTLPLAK